MKPTLANWSGLWMCVYTQLKYPRVLAFLAVSCDLLGIFMTELYFRTDIHLFELGTSLFDAGRRCFYFSQAGENYFPPFLLLSPGSSEQYTTFIAWEPAEIFSRTNHMLSLVIWIAFDLVIPVTQPVIFLKMANHWWSDLHCIS